MREIVTQMSAQGCVSSLLSARFAATRTIRRINPEELCITIAIARILFLKNDVISLVSTVTNQNAAKVLRKALYNYMHGSL